MDSSTPKAPHRPGISILDGLSMEEVAQIARKPIFRDYTKNQIIFNEGDTAEGLFVIVSGRVKVFRFRLGYEMTIAELGPDDILGEMGLILENGARTASVRALTATKLLEFPGNPLEILRLTNNIRAAAKLIQNLVCVIGQRIRIKNMESVELEREEEKFPVARQYRPGEAEAVETIRKSLPKGLLASFRSNGRLAPHQYLMREGDEPDGFYFIHSGTLSVEKAHSIYDPSAVARIVAPNIVGAIGFFAGRRRSASLLAMEPVTYTFFSGEDYRRLEKENPEEALTVAFAAAKLAVHLLIS